MDDTYVDFFLLNSHLMRTLYKERASSLAYLVAMDHAQSLDQYRGKVRLNTVKALTKERLRKISGEEDTEVPPDLTQILLINKNKVCFSTAFISAFRESQKHQPMVIVRSTPVPAPGAQAAPPQRKEWDYSNNLFGIKRSRKGYEYNDAKEVMAQLKADNMDLDALCKWRERKERLQLNVSAASVRTEYRVFSKKPVDYSQAKVKKSTTEKTEYRERKLLDES